jgi:predicted MFS family arabinose efflux permease
MIIVGAGCGTVSSLSALFVVYSLQGLGVGIMSPMVNTMIGQYLPQEKQSKAMGYLIASVSLSYLVSSPIISYLNNNHGWRSAFIYYQLPLAFVSLVVSYRYLPLLERDVTEGSSYSEGLGLIRDSRSALACLIGVLLGAVCWQSYLTYSTSFLRDVFGISVYTASIIMIVTSGSFTVGSVLSGGLCNRFGKKLVTVSGTLLLGVFTILFAFSPSFIFGVVIGCIGFFFGGLRVPGANGLALDQVPEYRGVMMSLSTGFVNIGNFIGTAVGGFVLDVYGWGVQGLMLGVFGLIGSLIYQMYSKENSNR